MKQTDEKKLAEARETLERLREARGGSISGGHRQLANDPALLKAFTDSFVDCCAGEHVIPEKYRQLMLMCLCAAKGYDIAVNHARAAEQAGAGIEEMGEAIRLIINVCGCPAILSVMDVFEEPEI
ncbi:MAG: carboxymuconolactone decarboxylase family protein [Eubacteriales bacterium]|nr:carboxymuconolactone decarboxylase family protein [Eubacteriales bacterium]